MHSYPSMDVNAIDAEHELIALLEETRKQVIASIRTTILPSIRSTCQRVGASRPTAPVRRGLSGASAASVVWAHGPVLVAAVASRRPCRSVWATLTARRVTTCSTRARF